MIHPLKASTSFECDGCGHHASFHRMENREEEGVVGRWREGESGKGDEIVVENGMTRVAGGSGVVRVEDVVTQSPKRRRIEGNGREVLDWLDGEEERASGVGRKRKGRGG